MKHETNEEEQEVPVIRPYGEAEIIAAAAKFGGKRNLREIIVESDGEKFAYLVKKPSRSVVQATEEAGSKNDFKTVQKLVSACVLEGDQTALEHDGAIYNEVMSQIGGMLRKVKSDVKKL